MYTPEEKKQLEQLEWQSHSNRVETSIKEVKGGYIIQHVTHYLDEKGTILGQTRDQFVTADQWGVLEAINSLYPDREFKPEQAEYTDYVTSPPPECDGPVAVPETERYRDTEKTGELMRNEHGNIR